jgi:hypothetical protein
MGHGAGQPANEDLPIQRREGRREAQRVGVGFHPRFPGVNDDTILAGSAQMTQWFQFDLPKQSRRATVGHP